MTTEREKRRAAKSATCPVYREKRRAAKKAATKRWHAKHPGYHRQWNIDNPLKAMLNIARGGARKRGIPFNITLTDLHWPSEDRCPLCTMPMARLTYHTPSVDRVDNTRGYEPDNVAIICQPCNLRKGNLTLVELKRLVSYVERSAK